MNEEKPKNYYSLNLTEGRIFIIFISVLIVITVLVFSIAFLISSNNRKNNNAKANSENEELQVIENDNFSYYNLNSDSEQNTFLDEKNNFIEEASKDEDKVVQNDNDYDQKGIQAKIEEKEESPEVVKLDNTNVLYSSKYSDKKETTNTASTQNKIQTVKKKTTTVTKKQTSTTKREVRYTVQIGSYLEKKTAEEISLYYQIQGYPAYIVEKTTGGKRFYRLRVGPFKEKDNAEKYLASLKSSKYGKESSIWVVYI